MLISPALELRPVVVLRFDTPGGTSSSALTSKSSAHKNSLHSRLFWSCQPFVRPSFFTAGRKPHSRFALRWRSPLIFTGRRIEDVGRIVATVAVPLGQAVEPGSRTIIHSENEALESSQDEVSPKSSAGNGSVWIGAGAPSSKSSSGSFTVSFTVMPTEEGALPNSTENHAPVTGQSEDVEGALSNRVQNHASVTGQSGKEEGALSNPAENHAPGQSEKEEGALSNATENHDPVTGQSEGALSNPAENHAPVTGQSEEEEGALSNAAENHDRVAGQSQEEEVVLSNLAENHAPVTGLLEEEAGIVEAEKLRRRRISDANKGRVPWNKGKRYSPGTLELIKDETLELIKDGTPMPPQNLKIGDENTSLLIREKWRRQRISWANKGKTPWNKGRCHSAETIARIKARTIEAMRDPKIREKLRLYGEAQSKETRLKISNALSNVWSVKKKFKQDQESCIKQWKEMIAEAARTGHDGDEVYEWNSYTILTKQLRDEWKLSIREEKKRARAPASSRDNRSMDHRIKISKAIKAKWADPNYRLSVEQGIRSYLSNRGIQVGGPRKKRTNSRPKNTQTLRKEQSLHAAISDNYSDSKEESDIAATLNRGTITSESKGFPAYKDPLTEEKLEKLKHMRAIRISEESRRRELTERARILMAEARRAERALEAAAVKDKNALGPLLETRRLLAEAARSFETAGLGRDSSQGLSRGEVLGESHRTDAASNESFIDSMKSQQVSSTTTACSGSYTVPVNTSFENSVWRIGHKTHFVVRLKMTRSATRLVRRRLVMGRPVTLED